MVPYTRIDHAKYTYCRESGLSLRYIIVQIVVTEIDFTKTWLSLTLTFAVFDNRSNIVSLKDIR